MPQPQGAGRAVQSFFSSRAFFSFASAWMRIVLSFVLKYVCARDGSVCDSCGPRGTTYPRKELHKVEERDPHLRGEELLCEHRVDGRGHPSDLWGAQESPKVSTVPARRAIAAERRCGERGRNAPL